MKSLWRHFFSRLIFQPVHDREEGYLSRNFDPLKSDLLMFNWRLKVVTALIRSRVIFCLYHLESKQEFSFTRTELAVCICIREWKTSIRRPDKLSSNELAWTGVNKSKFSLCNLSAAHCYIVIQSADFPIGHAMP